MIHPIPSRRSVVLLLTLLAVALTARICHAQAARRVLAITSTTPSSSSSSSSNQGSVDLKVLEKLLSDSVAFWLQHGIDKQDGGWYTNLDRNGAPIAPFDKNSKVQADNLYWLSLLAAAKYPVAGTTGNLSAIADETYAFLTQRMRRPDGLFAWETNRQGTTATMPGPHIFAQWQAITALAQYGRAFNNKAAIDAALQTFQAVDKRFYNATWGGYDPGKGEYLPLKTLPGGGNTTALPFNAFMQSIPAMGELYRSVKDPLLQQRLLEAVSHLCNDMPFSISTPITSSSTNPKAGKVVSEASSSSSSSSSNRAASLDSGSPLRFAMNYDPLTWQPAVVGDTSTAYGLNDSAVDYAHVLAHLWRALDVVEVLSAAGALPSASRNSCRQRLANVGAWYTANAFDKQDGGIMYAGYVGQPPAKTVKVGWTQTESLNTLFHLWQLTGDASYLKQLESTLNFIYNSELRDPKDGELFYQVDAKGKLMPADVKAGLPKAQTWKEAFHTIRPYARLISALRGTLGYIPGGDN